MLPNITFKHFNVTNNAFAADSDDDDLDEPRIAVRPAKPQVPKNYPKTSKKKMTIAKVTAPVKSAKAKPTKVAAKTVVTKLPAKVAKTTPPPKTPSFAQLPNEGKSQAQGWMGEIPGMIREVRASTANSDISLGTAPGLVVDGGFVLIPLDFVSDLHLAAHEVHFYTTQTPAQEIHLASIDLLANIAIFKLQAPLSPFLPIQKLRSDWPSETEALMLFKSSDTKPQSVIRLSDPTAERISGYFKFDLGRSQLESAAGYIFDHNGSLVGITSASEIDGPKNWGLAAPARSIWNLLKAAHETPLAANSSLDMALNRRHEQLMRWQAGWLKVLTGRLNEAVDVRYLQCEAKLLHLSDPLVASNVSTSDVTDCSNGHGLVLGAGYTAGVEVQRGQIQLSNSDRQPSSVMPSLTGAVVGDTFGDLARAAETVNRLSPPDCKQDDIINLKGDPVHVRFCTSALKEEPGLNDTAMVASTVDDRHKLSFVIVRLKAFDLTSSRKILNSLIENVRGQQ
jgi:hypothetical protein